MRFTVICKNKGESLLTAWEESYNKAEVTNSELAIAWAQQTIEGFNQTLRQGEIAREVVGVRMDAGNAELAHEWRKTNLVTIDGGGGASYDTARCERCGATGRRYGLSEHIALDKRFKNLTSCPGES